MSQENVEVVRKPLRVSDRTSRTVEQRLGIDAGQILARPGPVPVPASRERRFVIPRGKDTDVHEPRP